MSLAGNRVAKAYARLGRIVKIIGMIGWGRWVERQNVEAMLSLALKLSDTSKPAGLSQRKNHEADATVFAAELLN